MRFGIQMFGAAPVFSENPEYFFSEAARMGYRLIEPCISSEPEERKWTLDELEEYIPLMRKYGLTVQSCQVAMNICEDQLPRLEQLTGKYRIRQYVIGCPNTVTEEFYRKAVKRFISVAKRAASFGAEILLHNAKTESCVRFGEISAYEWLLNACEGWAGAQVDVGWLLYGGEDPESFLWRNQKIVKSLHYKDMRMENGILKEAPIGKGLLDIKPCFQFARMAEIPQISDQDISEDMMADLRETAHQLWKLTHCRERTKSILCVLDVESNELQRLHTFDRIIEAPNWMKDDDTLIYNSEGRLYCYRISSGKEEMIESGVCDNCNNDHVLSPDNTSIAISHCPVERQSYIYMLPVGGGEPRLVTENAPSFLHGWSPDGKELAYCAFRNGCVDIFTIPVEGGQERQLTAGSDYNDGPEYAPDGKKIWFNSTRTGSMQVWNMNADGSDQTQMTDHERNNWFPHVSPDGRKVVYLSYSQQGLDANEHLPNMWVELWLMNSDGTEQRKLLRFLGGQGSINVNSWSQDSRRVAFVIYELEHKDVCK